MSSITKTIISIVIVAIIIGGIWWGISKKPDSEIIKAEPIKVGFTSALTGNYANIGNDILKGVEGAFTEANQNNLLNGRKVEIIIEDNEANPIKAVSAYQALKAKNVKIVFSSFSGVTGALNPLSKQDNIILMYNAVTPAFAEENEYAFKVYADANQEAEILINNLKSSNKDIGLAYVNNPSGNLLLEKLKEKLNITNHSFGIKEMDFKTIILKLKDENIKNLIIVGYPGQILVFLRQIVELGYSPEHIFANSDGSVSNVVKEVENHITDANIKYITVGYGTEDQNYLFGHDLAKVLMEGMKNCQIINKQPDDTECLKKELLDIKIQGKSGFIEMNQSGVAIVSPKLFTVKNKKLVPYKE